MKMEFDGTITPIDLLLAIKDFLDCHDPNFTNKEIHDKLRITSNSLICKIVRHYRRDIKAGGKSISSAITYIANGLETIECLRDDGVDIPEVVVECLHLNMVFIASIIDLIYTASEESSKN